MAGLAWIWLTTFARSFCCGCDYFGLRRWSVRDAWFVAGVIAGTCAEIRRERADD